MCLYVIFSINLSDRVNSQKTGVLLESHSFSSKVIDTTQTFTVQSRLSQLWSRYWREKFTNRYICLFTGTRSVQCKHRSGSRAIHPTVAALLEATDSWAYNINIGKINTVIFLGLKKAFDTVDRNNPLSKLDPYGTFGNPLKWFQSYSENRTQQC